MDKLDNVTSLRLRSRAARTTATVGLAVAALSVSGVAVAAQPSGNQHASKPTAPPITVTTNDLGRHAKGDIFTAPYGTGAYESGAEILSPNGKKLVWFHPAAPGTTIADFRTQTYRGKPVLTFWQGTGLGGLSTGTDYIYNDHYKQIAAVPAGNGYSADGHEFLLAPHGTALILAYTETTANLTSIGGPADQEVIDGIVQRVDIKTGKVLWQWDSADHVPYSQSEQPLPASASTPWDWFHVNAVKIDKDGNYLIDARDTWTTYKVASAPRAHGKILWQLGGKDSSFALRAAKGQTLNQANKIFAWQHDAEGHGHGIYTVFDNESAGAGNTGAGASSELGYSRTVTIKIDDKKRTATLVHSNDQPKGLLAPSQGDTQLLPGGGQFVGWGAIPEFSQFDRAGRLVFDASYPTGYISYRAYRLPWRG